MGWREDREREEKVRELRRQQSELERDAAFARGLTFSTRRPLDPLPSFVTGRTPAKSRAINILARGVWKDPFPPEGCVGYIIVDSRGVRRRRIEMPAEDVTEDTVSQMSRWLDKHDPLLRVMA